MTDRELIDFMVSIIHDRGILEDKISALEKRVSALEEKIASLDKNKGHWYIPYYPYQPYQPYPYQHFCGSTSGE